MTPSGTCSSAAFDFSTSWQLDAPRTRVWDTLINFTSWQQWWPGLEELTPTRAGDADGIGQKARSSWRGPIGYQLGFSVEAIELRLHELLKGRVEGDLSGTGCWHLSECDGWTGVRLDWAVDVTRRWMEFLAPVARPVFVYGHDYLMEQGAKGLADHLDCELRAFSAHAN